MSDVQIVSNSVVKVKQATGKALMKTARMIGGTIERHAKEACPVDTGLLRNSITFAIGGETPNITAYSSNSQDKTGKKIEPVKGTYAVEAPKDKGGEVTVYVGTNVQYAPYQELGAPNANIEARPFLRPAMENFKEEIEQIIRRTLGQLK